jgi:hypothetical protein
MVNPHLDAPVRIAQDSEDGPPVPPDARVRICRSSGRMTSCPSSQSAGHSACGMLTNLVYRDPDAEPHGAPPLLLTHNRNYRPPAQATLCRAAQRECALEHAPVRTQFAEECYEVSLDPADAAAIYALRPLPMSWSRLSIVTVLRRNWPRTSTASGSPQRLGDSGGANQNELGLTTMEASSAAGLGS